jgi:oligoribonuclease
MDRYQSNLVWIDLEMTGLHLPADTILEIATIVTTNKLEIIGYGPALVIHQSEETLIKMDDWCKKYHKASGLIEQVRCSKITIQEAEEQTLIFLQQFVSATTAPLCGNSVWQDRAFIRQYMPRLDAFLNYRIIDVSSIKEIIRRWYPQNSQAKFVKPENHRALEDIIQSVEELAHYKKHFFMTSL